MSSSSDHLSAFTAAPRFQLRTSSGLAIEASIRADDGLLDEFYKDYDRAFVLPNEKEGYEGFADCLALNTGANYVRLRAEYGPYREYTVVVRGERCRIAGANFIVFPFATSQEAGLTVNLSYIFVNEDVRRRGYLRRFITDLPQLAWDLFLLTNGDDLPRQFHWKFADETEGAARAIYVFVEQNDPFKMSREAYQQDSAITGIDQADRIRMWGRLGAKIIDFDYVQPPLSARQEADYTLAYAVLGVPGDALDACILKGHLEKFFGISVLKGSSLQQEPSAFHQLEELAKLCREGTSLRILDARILPPVMHEPGHRPTTIRRALLKGL